MLTRQPNLKDMAASISIYIEIDDMLNGIIFGTEQLGTHFILEWAETALCPLNKGSLPQPLPLPQSEREREAGQREKGLCLLSREEEQQQGGENKALAANQI